MDNETMVAVTPEDIEAAKSPNGGWSRETLAAWGVPWPPPKGWKQSLTASQGCDWCGGSPIRDNLDGDDLCQQCCDKWVRAEGRFADAGKADQ